jgi:hypothetical protein
MCDFISSFCKKPLEFNQLTSYHPPVWESSHFHGFYTRWFSSSSIPSIHDQVLFMNQLCSSIQSWMKHVGPPPYHRFSSFSSMIRFQNMDSSMIPADFTMEQWIEAELHHTFHIEQKINKVEIHIDLSNNKPWFPELSDLTTYQWCLWSPICGIDVSKNICPHVYLLICDSESPCHHISLTTWQDFWNTWKMRIFHSLKCHHWLTYMNIIWSSELNTFAPLIAQWFQQSAIEPPMFLQEIIRKQEQEQQQDHVMYSPSGEDNHVTAPYSP